MKNRILGLLLLITMCVSGCGKSPANARDTLKDENVFIVESASSETGKKDNNKVVSGEFDSEAIFLDMRIGETVCVGLDSIIDAYQYKFTLNTVEYAEGSINGVEASSDFGGYIVLDITLEGVGPDISYGEVLTELRIDKNFQFAPESQVFFGLNVFSDPDKILTKGEKVTGRITIAYVRDQLTIDQCGMMSTKFTYNVEESDIKDYVEGEQ